MREMLLVGGYVDQMLFKLKSSVLEVDNKKLNKKNDIRVEWKALKNVEDVGWPFT